MSPGVGEGWASKTAGTGKAADPRQHRMNVVASRASLLGTPIFSVDQKAGSSIDRAMLRIQRDSGRANGRGRWSVNSELQEGPTEGMVTTS